MVRDSIKVVNAALDETPGGEIILRGVIDPDSLRLLKTAPYQREVLPLAKISELMKALETGTVPDIELGMRGGDYREREDCFYLQDDTYIIDGLQRVTAGIQLLQKGGDRKPRIGAAIYFSTTEPWERERFKVLNVDRTRLSPNVLLRNLKEDLAVIAMLRNLTDDPTFVMRDRICWDQRMTKGHLITAQTFASTVGFLHAHLGPGRSQRHDELAHGLQKIQERVGMRVMRDNIKTFFDVMDQCWSIRRVAFKEGAVCLRSTFLKTLATLFSRHDVFWRGDRLFVEKDIINKIAAFPITDPSIGQLAAGSSTAGQLLFQMLVEHVNSGKRTRRLVARNYEAPAVAPPVLGHATGANGAAQA